MQYLCKGLFLVKDLFSTSDHNRLIALSKMTLYVVFRAAIAVKRGRPSSLSFKGNKIYFRKTGGAVMRVKITLACTECKQRNYNTMKNKKNDPDRLEMNKYCRFCKKHTLHKETK